MNDINLSINHWTLDSEKLRFLAQCPLDTGHMPQIYLKESLVIDWNGNKVD